MEKIFDIAGQDAALEVYRDKIVIKRKGLISALNMREDKTILISAIRSMDVKKPSFLTVGWITFGTGGRERTEMFGDGLFTQFGNDTFSFAKTSYEEVLKAKEYLETKIGELHRPLQVTSASSGADELRKFKGLLDDGIISEAEYAEKKKQLLGGAELNSSVADLDLEKTRDTEAKKRAEQQKLVKQLGIEEQDFGQGYKVSGQKFYDLEDAIAYAQQQIEREKKAHTNPLVANKPPSESLDLPSAQDAHKGDKSQEPIVPQENYSWRREEAVVDSKQKKNKNTLPIFLGVTVIVAAVFWRLGTETGGTAEKKDTVKPSTSKPYSQFQEPRFQESLMRHPDTELTQRIGIFNGEQLDAFHNSDEALGWVMHGSKVVFITRADSDLRFSQVYSPKNREGDYSRRYFRFSASAGNSCEGPHFILEFRTDGVKVHKIDSCDFWGHVVNHLLFTQTEVLYKETPKGGL